MEKLAVNRPALKAAGLFAGIGGIELGLSSAGHKATTLCEIDPVAAAVLRHRFPEAELVPDVTAMDDLGDVDLATAGFPCQDLSQAGMTLGMAGSKSSTVAHVFRLLRKRRVQWVLLENVSFMLQLGKGEALELVVRSLEELGYRWAYRVVDSRAFGLPQRRQRVYLLASLDHDPRAVLFSGNEDPHEPKQTGQACGFYWTEGVRGLGWAVDAIPTLKGGSTIGIPSPPAIWLPNGDIVQPDIRDAERLQGFREDWTIPAESVARASSRWRLVGNAVSVNAAEWIGHRLRTFTDVPSFEESPLPQGKSWPRAAFNVHGVRKSAKLSAWPVRTSTPSLESFLKYEPKLLSQKATEGFYRRFSASNLRKPPGFMDALEAHLARMQGATVAARMAAE